MDFGSYLRLRAANEESAKFAYEFSTLGPELRLRDVPGKSVERPRWARWIRVVSAGSSREDPARDGVVRIALPPGGLLLRLPLRLALRVRARALSITNARVRAKRLPAEAAGTSW